MSGQHRVGSLLSLSHLRRLAFVLFCVALPLGVVCAQDNAAVPNPVKSSGISSAFVNTRAVNAAVGRAVAAVTNPSLTPVDDAGWLAGYLPMFDASGNLENSAAAQSGGNIGIGTATPLALLHLLSTNPTMRMENYGPAGSGDSPNFNFYSAEGTAAAPTQTQAGDNLGQFAAAGLPLGATSFGGSKVKVTFTATGNWTSSPLSEGTAMSFQTTAASDTSATRTTRMFIDNTGNVGIGSIFGVPALGGTPPPYPLTVAGIIQSTTGGIKFPDGTMQTTAVPSCTAGQTPVWSGTTWTCSFAANSLMLTTNSGLSGSGLSGNVLTLGVDTTVQRTLTSGCSTGEAISAISQTGSPTCVAVGGNAVNFPVIWPGSTVYVPNPPTTPNGVFNVTNTATGVTPPTSGIPDFTDVPAAVYGEATGSEITTGVSGYATGANGVGVFGWAPNSAEAGVVGIGETGGVWGFLPQTGAIAATSYILGAQTNATSGPTDCAGVLSTCGVYGVGVKMKQATSGTTVGFGSELASAESVGIELLFDQALSGSSLTGTVGNMIEATTNGGAPYFLVEGNGNVNISGNLDVVGTISGGTKTFKIDHPLDPANKYLTHSVVESPDMMNIYNGVIVLDKRGKAVVQLPDYFEALNQDFRYQLTSIGAPGPNLYVSNEVKGNKFVIAGGKPGAKVSWQVTGIRHDAYAEANRIKVEEDKGDKRGSYIHPELFQKDPVLAKK